MPKTGVRRYYEDEEESTFSDEISFRVAFPYEDKTVGIFRLIYTADVLQELIDPLY